VVPSGLTAIAADGWITEATIDHEGLSGKQILIRWRPVGIYRARSRGGNGTCRRARLAPV
jgi:hypothetical protein